MGRQPRRVLCHCLRVSKGTPRGANHCWPGRQYAYSLSGGLPLPFSYDLPVLVLTPGAPVGQEEPLSRVRHSKAAVLSASLPQGSHACSYGLSPRSLFSKHFANLPVTFLQIRCIVCGALLKMRWVEAGCHLDNRDKGLRRKEENPSYMLRVTIREAIYIHS